MKKICLCTVIFLVGTALVSVCHADTVEYTIIGPTGFADCTFSEGPGSYWISATLNLSASAKALELSSWQGCNGPGISWNYPVSGDPNFKLTVDFGGCIAGSVTLYTATFEVDGGCCPALLNGPIISPNYTQESPPVLIGCDDQPRFLIPPCSANTPALLTPADGATDVSPTPFMSWDYAYEDYCHEGLGLAIFTILYGTDPANLDQSFNTLDSSQLTLPALAPNTQYFWKVRVWDDWGYYTGSMINYSETRSFTTGGAVPVERTTWGEVKSLYQK